MCCRGLRLAGSAGVAAAAGTGFVRVFFTSDLVSRSQSSCYFQDRCGGVIKVLGTAVSLQAMERIIRVHCRYETFLCPWFQNSWVMMFRSLLLWAE